MGGAFSSNTDDNITNIVSKTATNIIQRSITDSNSQNIISVSGGKGDVNIHDNYMNQTANVHVNALFKAMATQQSQTDIMNSAIQSAKSENSGLNMGQVASASNKIKNELNAMISVLMNISMTCSTSSNQVQEIIVDHQDGNVNIHNNSLTQIQNLFQKCIGDAISNNSQATSVINKEKQTAAAINKGLNLDMILILLFLLLALFGFFVYKEEQLFVNKAAIVMGIVMFIIGIVFIFAWRKSIKTLPSGHAFSRLIQNVDTNAVPIKQTNTITTLDDAKSKLMDKSNNYVAFDFIAYDINDKDNSFIPRKTPTVIFYSHVSSDIESRLSKQVDKTKIAEQRSIICVPGPPDINSSPSKYNMLDNDMYINSNTSEWYLYDEPNNQFNQNDKPLIKSYKGDPIRWVTSIPQKNGPGTCCMMHSPNHPFYIDVYQKNDTGAWDKTAMNVPGPKPAADFPDQLNMSFTKVKVQKKWEEILGIGMFALSIPTVLMGMYISRMGQSHSSIPTTT